MTDNEIIKALEEFHHRILKTYLSYHIWESEMMAVCEALNLINRQKAEIERLKSDNDILSKNMHNLCKELDAEKLKNF